jgi:hypothetical protein
MRNKEMRKLLLICLLGIFSLTTSGQEIIREMTRDRTVGYLEELLNEIKADKSCDTCKIRSINFMCWIIQDGTIHISERVKYKGDDKVYMTVYIFDPALIDSLIVSTGNDDMIRIGIRFPSNSVLREYFGSENHSQSTTHTNIIYYDFLKGKNEDRIRETIMHLKDLSLKEKMRSQN